MKKQIILTILWILLGILSILYSIMVFCANSGSDFFVIWAGLGVFFIFLGVAAKIGLWKKLPKAIKIAFLSVLGFGVSIVLVFEIMILSKFHSTAPDKLDYLIVLGAQVHEDRPSIVLKYRLDAALEYLNNNPDTYVIVSGGKGDYEPFSEALGMSRYLIQNGIDESRIILEPNSTDTLENIRFSMESIPEGASVGIVTNNFHLFRALQIAKDQGIDNPYGIAADSRWEYLPNNMFREFFGEGKYLLRLLLEG